MEAEWVRFFTQVVGSPLTTEEEEALAGASKFTLRDYAAYKKLEEVTRHDVKAIERFLSSRLAEHTRLIPLIHFGLTSEDVNNLAYGRLLKRAVSNVVLPELITLLGRLVDIVEETAEVAMAARTHGQPASPTTLGKELAVHAHRLARRVGKLRRVRLEGKLAGAVGNYGALYAAHPGVDWVEQSKKFVSKMGLTFTGVATQILPADSYTDLFHELYSLNCVLNGLNRDIWLYSSYGYVYEARVAGQVGSSAMPHKSNPIDFENSEGNLEVANALLSLLFSKLATSRMQRDLSDSTVKRNFGSALGYCAVAYRSTANGLAKLRVNSRAIESDLKAHPEIYTELIQTLLRTRGDVEGFSQLSEAYLEKSYTLPELIEFAASRGVDPELVEQRVSAGFTGAASRTAREVASSIRGTLLKGTRV